MIPYYEVPRDEEDPRFVKSFSLTEPQEALDFFNQLGFVVFRDCLTQEECQNSVDAMFRLLDFDPANADTWTRWPSEGMEKYAMPTRSPVFEPEFLQNRQNPNVHRAFGILLGRDDLLSNHDRCCLFRPTRRVPFPTSGNRDMPSWRTAHNLHLDMNPWKYADTRNRCVEALDALEYRPRDFIFENNQVTFRPDEVPLQGVINLLDNLDEDGGFIVVPGFRNHFSEWLEATTPVQPAAAKAYNEDENGYRFSERDPMQQLAIRIAMRQGSVVIWDQRTPHGSTFNKSSGFRAAQFIRMFPAEISHQRANRRARALRAQFREHGFGDEMISDVGRVVFGL